MHDMRALRHIPVVILSLPDKNRVRVELFLPPTVCDDCSAMPRVGLPGESGLRNAIHESGLVGMRIRGVGVASGSVTALPHAPSIPRHPRNTSRIRFRDLESSRHFKRLILTIDMLSKRRPRGNSGAVWVRRDFQIATSAQRDTFSEVSRVATSGKGNRSQALRT